MARIQYFDTIKTVAISLVVMQHCFLYFDNGIFQHYFLNKMSALVSVPMFMFVSGFFNYTIEWKTEKLKKRFFSLMIPFFIWSYIYYFYENNFTLELDSIYKYTINLFAAPYFPSTMWFLRTLFLEIVILYVCHKICKRHTDLCIVITYITLLIIDILVTDKFAIKSISGNFPFFILGFWVRKYSIMEKSIFNYVSIACIPIFLFVFYAKEITTSGIILSILFKLSNLLGIMSSLAVIRLLYNLIDKQQFSTIESIGKHTIEIYTSHFLIIWLLRDFNFSIVSNLLYFSYLSYLFISLFLTIGFTKIIKQSKFLSRILYAK